MKVIDLTGGYLMIWEKKQLWEFRCNRCRYYAIFRLWSGTGMATRCGKCNGDMERVRFIGED